MSFETGESVSYGLFNAQERGALFIGPGVAVYEGMVVGVSPKQEDITVNVCRKKQMTNMRAAGSDEALRLVPPRKLSLEQCLEFLADDELLEVTPCALAVRRDVFSFSSVQTAGSCPPVCQYRPTARWRYTATYRSGNRNPDSSCNPPPKGSSPPDGSGRSDNIPAGG